MELCPFVPSGTVRAPDSKSHLHRLLFCAALGNHEVNIICGHYGRDIEATVRCLRALGAEITDTDCGLSVRPIRTPPTVVCLDAGESGTTLRLLLPILGALGVSADILCRGRLSQRPIAPLDAVLCTHGMEISRDGALLRVRGILTAGHFRIAGNVSSQFITALLLALPLLDGESRLEVLPPVESAGYILLTEQVIQQAGICCEKDKYVYIIYGNQHPALPSVISAEGDWSNAAALLCMGAFSPGSVTVTGLSAASCQPDRAVSDLLRASGAELSEAENGITVREGRHLPFTADASACPDLVPVLCVLAACALGESRIVNAARLRLKESDRLSGMAELLRTLGAEVSEAPDALTIRGVPRFRSCLVDTRGDHRLAMAAAVAACRADGAITLSDAACVGKSDPFFWETYQHLGGCCL